MINEATIQAQFKQSGKTVLLTVAEQQQAMDFDDETGEIYG
jgi:hypothetical protein